MEGSTNCKKFLKMFKRPQTNQRCTKRQALYPSSNARPCPKLVCGGGVLQLMPFLLCKKWNSNRATWSSKKAFAKKQLEYPPNRSIETSVYCNEVPPPYPTIYEWPVRERKVFSHFGERVMQTVLRISPWWKHISKGESYYVDHGKVVDDQFGISWKELHIAFQMNYFVNHT